jgi:RNA-binding protein YlmH
VAQILDQAERAATRWEVTYTHFVSPPVAADALAAINQRADIKAVAWGGYPQAERCRVAIGKEEVMLPAQEDPSSLDDAVAALDIRGNFMFDPATHRDFLGAIIGTGVVRDRIGVSETTALNSRPRSRRPPAAQVSCQRLATANPVQSLTFPRTLCVLD